MSSPYQTIRSSRVGVVVVAMTAVFLQRTTSAFMGGTIAASPRSFLSRQFTTSAVVVGSRVFGGGNPLGLLQVRGGAAFGNNPRGGFPIHATVSASSSSSAASSTSAALSSSGGDKGGVDLDKEAQATLGIVGKSIQASTFAGEIPYLNTQDCNEFRVLFVLGGPGAGKGTQSDLMKANYPCVHLSAGELLRAETKKEESPHKDLIEQCLVSGNIVPVEISLSLLRAAMQEAAEEQGASLIFLVDGFPRNFDNLQGWMRCMSNNNNENGAIAKGVASVWGVLNYVCPLEELERRILNRAKEGSGRSDDNLQSARKRFATFARETEPVVETLRKVQQQLSATASLQVFDIRADQTIEDVWKDTQAAMNQMISNDVLTANAQLLHAIQTQDADLYRALCADEWFKDKSAPEVLKLHEGTQISRGVSNVKMTFLSGTKVAVQYDRELQFQNDNDGGKGGDGEIVTIQEKRIWSHQGKQGWKNIHFARLPADT